MTRVPLYAAKGAIPTNQSREDNLIIYRPLTRTKQKGCGTSAIVLGLFTILEDQRVFC